MFTRMSLRRFSSLSCHSCSYTYLPLAAGIAYITMLSITHDNTQRQQERALTKQLHEIRVELETVKNQRSMTCQYLPPLATLSRTSEE
jgi:sensor domain CHASE-containing protein